MQFVLHEAAVTVAPAGSAGAETRVRLGAHPGSRTVVGVGPVEVTAEPHDEGIEWWVANRSDRAVPLRSVAVVLLLAGALEPVRMFRHGYQSWSPSGLAVLGQHVDPSCVADLPFLQGVYHADAQRCADGEIRSEWCTALADAAPHQGAVVLGFGGGHRHDGTFRLRRRNDGGIELAVEAFLGGAELGPGETRHLHPVWWERTEEDGPGVCEMLARWAGSRAGGSRSRGWPFLTGWCSWYHYFDAVTENDIRANLRRAADWPFDVFQIDDGYQAAIGDWRHTNDKFPSGLDELGPEIRSHDRTPGLWLAPFLVAPDSEVARAHPDWIARAPLGRGDAATAPGEKGEPLRSWWNPAWGGGEKGFMYSLDTTHPEVLAHLEALAHDLVWWAGFRYLKLDFTFAPGVEGRWHDRSRTPAERVRAGFEAIRRGAGDDTFLLGCGVPLANVVGLVDANRIGADVAPRWALDPSEEIVAGYLDVQPATRSAYAATVARAFMHRRLWLNDPDCIMLRTTSTELSPVAATTWAHCVGVSGGLVMVSDDLALLDAGARRLFDEVVALGRSSDAEAVAGTPPRVPDLMDHAVPTVLAGGGAELVTDPGEGSSELRAHHASQAGAVDAPAGQPAPMRWL